MNQPGQPQDPQERRADPPQSEESRRDAEEDFGQWVLLVVLLACWLAEASL